MDLNSPVVQICIQVTQAEFQGNRLEAKALSLRAWELAADDFERCVAAHYVARFQDAPEDSLRWNLEAFDRSQNVEHEKVKDFYPSLYLSLGRSYEQLGDLAEARRYYDLAAELGFPHQSAS
jgi:hypothetical protein